MMRALWTAGTGMSAQQANIDVISNNLANVNTTGFKKVRTDFQDLMYQTLRQPGVSTGPDNQSPTGIQMGHGVRQAATERLFTPGSYQSTSNPLDLAIENDGFFQIQMPDGSTGYTRDGSFKRDSQGRVTTTDGYFLIPQITIPANATNLSVSSDGIVSFTIPGQTATQDQGPIVLARFINPSGLDSIGRNLFKETAASGTPTTANPGDDGMGTIVSQYLEMSNVQVVEEMVNMIVAQRAYEVNSKAVQASDEMLSQAASLKR